MAGDSEQVGQDEIEQLLKQAQGLSPSPPPAAPAAPAEESGSLLGQDEIESLLKGGSGAAAAKRPATNPPPAARPKVAASSSSGIAQGDVEYLLNQAEQALASINAPASASPQPPVMPFKLQDFAGAPASAEAATLDLIRDVELDLKIELGRTNMYLEDVLKLRKGSVVPLDKMAGDPVDIFVNGRLIARGEVLVLNDNFCVRVAELIAGEAAA
jgi:flagellar motor switch protein FliN/FliY